MEYGRWAPFPPSFLSCQAIEIGNGGVVSVPHEDFPSESDWPESAEDYVSILLLVLLRSRPGVLNIKRGIL